MKNFTKLALLMLFAFLSLNVNAQIAIGPKIGVNIATIGGDDVETDDIGSIVGLQFGAAAEIGINEMFAIQPELLYFQKGASIDLGTFGEIDQVLNYLEIPILVKVMFGAEDGPQFFATVGPSFGFGLNGKVKSGDDEEDIDFDEDMITKLDIGASIGAGAQFAAGPGKLFVDVRYLLGLNSTDDSEADLKIMHRGIGIAAGFLFPLGGE
jgi:outer membrane protein with beta-barrel domain